jgi:two-component system, NarL family, sensor histidine kinase BarA
MEEFPSLLQQPVRLADIIDQEALQRVCASFANLYQMGISICNPEGERIVDVANGPSYCQLLQQLRQQTRGCLFTSIEVLADETHQSVTCNCGLHYQRLPIRQQKEELGYLLLGPYQREEGEPVQVDLASEFGGQAAEQLAQAYKEIPERGDTEIGALATGLSEILAVIVQTGYARHLTSQIHIAAIQDAYNELSEKNRRLADSVEKLKELDKLKSNFLATVSHELRTPLTSVIGYSEMLLEGLAGDIEPLQREYVQTIMAKGDQLLQIISEILDISKIESGTVQLTCEPMDLPELLRQVTDAMMPQARQKAIQLRYQAPQGLPAVSADRAKTRQVLLNLLSNSIKFTPDGGRVEVGAHPCTIKAHSLSAPAIEIRVSDTGIGIPKREREQVFEAFYQVDGSSTRTYGGTGLGLSIVKHFVEAHGGEVFVESGPEDVGSSFVVRLPLTPVQGARLVG